MNTLKLIKEQACPSSYKETSQNEPEVPIKRQEIKQSSKRISEIRIITLADEASFHLKSMKKMKPTSLKTLLWARVPLPRDKTEETHDLCRILRDHRSINSISLTLWFQNQFEAQALALTMQKLNSLRSLKLSLGGWKHIVGFSKKIFLASLKHLQYLSLSLGVSIDDIGLEELSNGLKNLSSLSEFCLKVYQNFYISDKGIVALSEGLKRLRSLSSLTFYIADVPIADEE